MAFYHLYSLCAFLSLLSVCSSFNPKVFNASKDAFAPTVATFYGPDEGAGSDGGACGFEGAVEKPPYNKFVSAGGSSLFKNGEGCGECYQVKCNSNPACSGNPVTITIADLCPGNCGSLQFDLSGTAFGAMAAPGKAAQLRTAGRIDILYQRVPCNYGSVKILFHVDAGSNPYYFATNIEYENGDGDLGKVELQEGSGPFKPMQEVFGATWKLNSGSQLIGPLSIRLTTLSGKTLTAFNVIPVGWKPGQYFTSQVNF